MYIAFAFMKERKAISLWSFSGRGQDRTGHKAPEKPKSRGFHFPHHNSQDVQKASTEKKAIKFKKEKEIKL